MASISFEIRVPLVVLCRRCKTELYAVRRVPVSTAYLYSPAVRSFLASDVLCKGGDHVVEPELHVDGHTRVIPQAVAP